VIGNGSPASCTSAAFVAAVAKGGVITFNCGSEPVTITLTETAKVVNDAAARIVIDGGGKVTLSGGGQRRILYMNTCDPDQVWTTPRCDNQDHPQLTIQNLTFVDGRASGANAPELRGAALCSPEADGSRSSTAASSAMRATRPGRTSAEARCAHSTSSTASRCTW
jgi:hypothetical protein